MKTVLVLLKKDIMLDKKYLLITVFIAFGIPIFIAKSLSGVNIPGGTGFIGLLLSSFYGYFMMFSKIGLIEEKYHAEEYILLTPVSRQAVVLSKYLMVIFIFVLNVLGYVLDSLFLEMLDPIHFSSISVVLLLNCLFMGVYIPLEFKIGYENIKYLLMVAIIAIPFGAGGIGKAVNNEIAIKLVEVIKTLTPYFSLIAVMILLLSFFLAKMIYEKKDI